MLFKIGRPFSTGDVRTIGVDYSRGFDPQLIRLLSGTIPTATDIDFYFPSGKAQTVGTILVNGQIAAQTIRFLEAGTFTMTARVTFSDGQIISHDIGVTVSDTAQPIV